MVENPCCELVRHKKDSSNRDHKPWPAGRNTADILVISSMPALLQELEDKTMVDPCNGIWALARKSGVRTTMKEYVSEPP